MAAETSDKHEWMKLVLGVEVPQSATPGGGAAGVASEAPAPDDGDDKNYEADWQKALKAKNWKAAAMALTFMSNGGRQARLSKLSGAQTGLLHKGACESPDLGASSEVAIATAVFAHPTISPEQEGRAGALEKKLSPEDQTKYRALLDGAKSPKEKQFITKGLAANHSVAELAAFAAKIAGKDAKWMQDNLSLTGASDGTGVKQQWHDSCGPTTFEAVQGELDPLYALKKHEDNPRLNQADNKDGAKDNPDLAADQRAILEGGGGLATNRETKGGGMWITDNLKKVSASTGLTYDNKKIGEGATLEEGITTLNDATAKGEPVPIVIGNGGKDFAHYVLVTASDPGPPRYYKIHDPWSGETVTRSEKQMRSGQLDIAGGLNDFEAFAKPTPVAVAP